MNDNNDANANNDPAINLTNPNVQPAPEPTQEAAPSGKEMKIILITQDVMKTSLLQQLGLFEAGKVILGPSPTMGGILKASSTVADGLAELRASADAISPQIQLIAIFVPGNPEGAWYDPAVKIVSTGTQWITFHEMLVGLEYAGVLEPPATFDQPADVSDERPASPVLPDPEVCAYAGSPNA